MDANDILKDWATMNEHLMDLSENECRALLEKELKGQNRTSFLIRITGRINKLRARRETARFLTEGKKK